MRYDRPAAVEHAREIDRDGALPVLVALLPDGRGLACDPRVIDQDVNAAGAADDFVDRLSYGIRIRDVSPDGEGAIYERAGDLSRAFEIQVQHTDGRAGFSEPPRDCLADPGGASGDDGYLSAQVEIHKIGITCFEFSPKELEYLGVLAVEDNATREKAVSNGMGLRTMFPPES